MAITGVQGNNSPYITVVEHNSVQGFTLRNTIWVFGLVSQVFPGCTKISVGDSVFFDKSKGFIFKSGATNYICIDIQYVFFTEKP